MDFQTSRRSARPSVVMPANYLPPGRHSCACRNPVVRWSSCLRTTRRSSCLRTPESSLLLTGVG